MSRTGGFDLSLQLRVSGLLKVLHAQHRINLIPQSFSKVIDNRRVTIVVNPPTAVAFTGNTSNPKQVLAAVQVKLVYQTRLKNVGHDIGDSAVAQLSARLRIGLSEDGPILLGESPRLVVSWSDTTSVDVQVAGAAAVHMVESDILQLLATYGQLAFTLRQFRILDRLATHLDLHSHNDCLNVGLGFSDYGGASAALITDQFSAPDWGVGLSRDLSRELLGAAIGSIQLPYRLSHSCTLDAPWPISGCWNWTTVDLIELALLLSNGYLLLLGRLDVRNSGALIPDVSPRFSARLTPTVSDSGDIALSVTHIEAEMASVIGTIVNFLSGGAIESAVSQAIDSQLAIGSAGFGGVLSEETLNGVINSVMARNPGLQVKTRSVSVDPNGLYLKGEIVDPGAENLPTSEFYSIEHPPSSADGERAFTFIATGSRASASEISRYHWEFSDGAQVTYASDNLAFVTEHSFANCGIIRGGNACLTVTDSGGRQASSCEQLWQSSIPDFRPEDDFDFIPPELLPPVVIFQPEPPSPGPPGPLREHEWIYERLLAAKMSDFDALRNLQTGDIQEFIEHLGWASGITRSIDVHIPSRVRGDAIEIRLSAKRGGHRLSSGSVEVSFPFQKLTRKTKFDKGGSIEIRAPRRKIEKTNRASVQSWVVSLFTIVHVDECGQRTSRLFWVVDPDRRAAFFGEISEFIRDLGIPHGGRKGGGESTDSQKALHARRSLSGLVHSNRSIDQLCRLLGVSSFGLSAESVLDALDSKVNRLKEIAESVSSKKGA